MANKMDRAGTFRAQFTEYGLTEQQSGAVAVTVKAKILAQWDHENQAWEDWEQYDCEALGDLYIVKKDNTVNKKQCESLCEHCGWDGTFTAITNQTWEPTPCQVVINPDEYKDEVRYKISFVNDYERTPGAVGNIDATKAKVLETKHGASMRAIFGTVKSKKASTPGSRPASPPAKNGSMPGRGNPAMPTEQELAEAKSGADLPF